MGWSVELAESAVRELAKLDPEQRKRILKFLGERVAKLDIRASSERPCTARG
jgi:mRNA-degrading endonuclease RelE of RelBE toxin-antitoxin system